MPTAFDRADINRIHQASDIVDIVAEHVSLTKKGREMVGLCPFHDDHKPSLCVNPAKQIFKCFACGAGGSVFTFVQMRENLTFPQAVERLAQRAGIKLKPAARTDQKTDPDQPDPNKLAKLNAFAANHFHRNLLNTETGRLAREYLAQRKITNDSIKKWRLGLALNSTTDLVNAAKKRGVPEKLLVQAGLVTAYKTPAHPTDKFINRIIFPITDVTNRIIGFGARALDDQGPKYLNSPATPLFDKSNSVYGLNHARHQIVATATAVLVEGYTDCIMAHQLGCANVVGALGTSLTPGHVRLLRRYAKQIILVFDSDTAGVEAANRALEICLSQPVGIKIVALPEGMDPCDFLLSQGRQKFEQLLANATDVFEFKWKRLTRTLSEKDTVIDHKAALEEYLQAVATAMHAGNLPAIDQGLIANRLAKIVGLNPKQINAELQKRLKRAQRNAAYNHRQNQSVTKLDLGRGFYAQAQREILEVLLNRPQLFEPVKDQITPDIFDVPVYKQIASTLLETLTSNGPDDAFNTVIRMTQSTDASGLVIDMADAGEQKANYQARLDGALAAVLRYRAAQARDRIKQIKDHKQLLRRLTESTAKDNPYTVGLT